MITAVQLSVGASAGFVMTVTFIAIMVAGSSPLVPVRIDFHEIQGRALRVRDIGLPSAAAVVLGFFVSLAASLVHSNFEAPIAVGLGLNPVAYLGFLFFGASLSFSILMFFLERVRTGARDLARHPSSINRAADAMLRGARLDNLEPRELQRNLTRWERGRGASAMRSTPGARSSPLINAVFAEYAPKFRIDHLPRGFTRQLTKAYLGDFPRAGYFVLAVAGVAAAAAVTGLALGTVLAIRGDVPAWMPAVPVALLIGQGGASAWCLRAEARLAIRRYRIDSIELQAAHRRLARLLREPDPVPPPAGLLGKLVARLCWSNPDRPHSCSS